MTRIGAADLQYLADNGFVVVKNFLPKSLQKELIQDVSSLRKDDEKSSSITSTNEKKNPFFTISKIGHDGMIQSETTPYRDIRISETCFLGRQTNNIKKTNEKTLPPSDARDDLYDIVDNLRSDLQLPMLNHGRYTKDVPALDNELEEIMYAYYPNGGYYRRHCDAEKGSISDWRKYSFLLYLNPNWEASHGGQLRLHRDSGKDTLPPGELPNFMDIEPKSGTLVLFRSDLIPHEVLDTHCERLAIVGWFLSKGEKNASDKISIEHKHRISPSTLKALRSLRKASPRLKYKLEPSTNQTINNQNQQSGLLGDAFFFPMETKPPKSDQTESDSTKIYDDTDPSYWKSIATFSLDGNVNTLSLNGQRIASILQTDYLYTLVEHAVTLDFGNTDISCENLIDFIHDNKHLSNLRHLYLAGFGIGNANKSSLAKLVNILPLQLHTLDLRYNDLGPEGASLLGKYYLTNSNCMCQILHLEGNALYDEGVQNLFHSGTTKSVLQELYMGQNHLGSTGAKCIAENLCYFRHLKKLYLDGNQIGSDGAKAFRMALEAMGEKKVLTSLYVDNNGIDKEEAIRLGKSLNSATMIGTSAFFVDE